MTELTEDLAPWRRRLLDRGFDFDVPPSPREDYETETERKERLQLQWANQNARSARQVPLHYRSAFLQDLDRATCDKLLAWRDGESPTLILVGTVGAGKTHAAYALRNEIAMAGQRVASFHMADVMHALRPEGDPGDVRDLRTCPMLLLDDVGVTKLTDWGAAEIDALVDERTRRDLRQIITTNLSGLGLREHLGERTASRLTAGAVVVPFTGPDRRQVSW